MARNNLGIYRPDSGSSIVGGLNRFASPWANQGSCDPSLYPCYRVFVDDNGDTTAASRKRGRGLKPADPAGFIYGRRGRK